MRIFGFEISWANAPGGDKVWNRGSNPRRLQDLTRADLIGELAWVHRTLRQGAHVHMADNKQEIHARVAVKLSTAQDIQDYVTYLSSERN